MRTLFAALLLTLAATSCRPPGMSHVPTDQILAVNELDRLMWVQADTADPRFDLAEDVDPKTYTAKQLGEFVDMGVRMQLTSQRLIGMSKEDGFKALAGEQQKKAAQLEKVARAGDGPGAAKLALSVRETCRTCHKKYR